MPKKERRKTSDIMQIIRSKGDHDTVRPIEIGLQTHQWPPCSLNPTKPEVESGRRLNGLVVRGRAWWATELDSGSFNLVCLPLFPPL